MSTQSIAELGLLFLIVGFAATFTMYHLWGYPFDKETRRSAAPRWAMYMHRGLGYLFVLIYLGIMWHMVPRLWEYQVEFSARATVHIVLGFTIGCLLVIKISIMRFFRHFEEWMPYLGTAILIGTVILLGLSVPFVFRERALAAQAGSDENLARVQRLLPVAGLPEDTDLQALGTKRAVERGRQVLLAKCVHCHDLKTVLSRSRTPAQWYSTVERMADKPMLFAPIRPTERLEVTAYLIAITPRIQESQKQLRLARLDKAKTLSAAEEVSASGDGGELSALQNKKFDPSEAKETFEDECSMCHELSDIDKKPPKTAADIDPLIDRMIENDLDVDPPDLEKIKWYLLKHFVDKEI